MSKPIYKQLYDGQMFDLANPDWRLVGLNNIAQSLSSLARFTGHTRGAHAYSVAQHSVLVANILHLWGADPQTQLWGLLHDAHESFIGDISSPALIALDCRKAKKKLTAKLDEAIRIALMPDYIGDIDCVQVKDADLCALQTERQDLLPESDDSYWPMLDGVEAYPDGIEPLCRDVARIGFLAKFALLSAKL